LQSLGPKKIIISVLDGRNGRGFDDRLVLERIESKGGDDGSDLMIPPQHL
jgi:hypothetical protein